MKSPTRIALASAVALAIACAAPAFPQTYSVFDAGKRTQVAVHVGALTIAEQETGSPEWSGVEAGGAIVYSLHKQFSLVGTYDHGFPITSDRDHRNYLRAVGNLKVYPPPTERSATNLFIGGGYMVIDRAAGAESWQGGLGQVVVSHLFADGWGVYGSYIHGFARDELEADVNVAKLGLQHRLFGAR
ncbi:MAG TPA: hypothetical protein VJY35_15510 [Candidatus Eisenbacteria bacterium]|nr:hypothetical protein [Candidatus Eisenbacteria bacterium]